MALFDFLSDNWPLLLAPLLGLVAVYALLPRPKRPPLLLGIGAGSAAMLLAGVFIVRVGGLTVETCLFYVFAAVAVLSGGLLVTQQNPARAALSFALVVLATCGLFLLQAGPFLMAASIIIYAGAIIVTFLFVIMLAQQEGVSSADARSREPFLSTLTGFLLLCALLYILKVTYKPGLDSWVERSGQKLERIQELREKGNATADEVKALVKDLTQFRSAYDRWWHNEWLAEKRPGKTYPPGGKPLYKALYDAEEFLPKDEDRMVGADLERIERTFAVLYDVGLETQKDPLLGGFRPHSTRLSDGSGPPASVPSRDPNGEGRELRRDDLGRPHLPADNTAYLGRSLFTDYLLAVELAGMLLLVATVGAIAIAQRHGAHGPRPTTPPERKA